MQVPVLLNFLNDVPHPLTAVLVQLAPCISCIRSFMDIVSWKTPWYESWLLIALWWFICLLGDLLLRYTLPFLIFLVFAVLQQNTLTRPTQPLVNEAILQTSITDLQSIQSLLPSPPSLPNNRILTRTLLFLYVPILILTHCIRLRILIAMTGTFFLTYRAPWAIVLREVLWKSAHLRWAIYNLWSHLSGQPTLLHNIPHDTEASSAEPVNVLRFLFTICENQRWWMGLDWTAALLPGERPSWCSMAMHPVSPPNAFSLPKSTVIAASDGRGGIIKRTAIWRWEEPEWRVIVCKSDGGLSRVERPLPSIEKDGVNRLLKGKRRDSSVSTTAMDKEATDSYDNAEVVETAGPDDTATDSDGWVYGDNKWENQSNKGGISKYTRYRRWTRIATVYESVESVSEGKIKDAREESTDSLDSAIIGVDEGNEINVVNRPQEYNPLRQRLKNLDPNVQDDK